MTTMTKKKKNGKTRNSTTTLVSVNSERDTKTARSSTQRKKMPDKNIKTAN